jgi:hypothetical protein
LKRTQNFMCLCQSDLIAFYTDLHCTVEMNKKDRQQQVKNCKGWQQVKKCKDKMRKKEVALDKLILFLYLWYYYNWFIITLFVLVYWCKWRNLLTKDRRNQWRHYGEWTGSENGSSKHDRTLRRIGGNYWDGYIFWGVHLLNKSGWDFVFRALALHSLNINYNIQIQTALHQHYRRQKIFFFGLICWHEHLQYISLFGFFFLVDLDSEKFLLPICRSDFIFSYDWFCSITQLLLEFYKSFIW